MVLEIVVFDAGGVPDEALSFSGTGFKLSGEDGLNIFVS